MKKLKKKAKGKKEVEEEEQAEDSKEVSKLDIMVAIDDLKSSQNVFMVEGNDEKAMQCANKIIEYAIRYKMSYYIKEQEDFLKRLAKKAQIKYFTSEIEKECLSLNEIYDNLIETNQFEQAHQKIEDFKRKYMDNSIFETLPFITALLDKDRKIWIKYLSTGK
jgi:hypothetical protein